MRMARWRRLLLLSVVAANAAATERDPAALRYPVWWHAPFWSGTGYGSEASSFMLGLLRSHALRPQDLWATQHGDMPRKDVTAAMEDVDRRDLQAMADRVDTSVPSIIVCHSLPEGWFTHSRDAGACPPDPRSAAFVYMIGRTMFETDMLPAGFVPRCQAMNEIWVPSEFGRDVFIRAGVDSAKIRVVPEGVNTTWFDPARHTAVGLPQGERVFGGGAGAALAARPQAQPQTTTIGTAPRPLRRTAPLSTDQPFPPVPRGRPAPTSLDSGNVRGPGQGGQPPFAPDPGTPTALPSLDSEILRRLGRGGQPSLAPGAMDRAEVLELLRATGQRVSKAATAAASEGALPQREGEQEQAAGTAGKFDRVGRRGSAQESAAGGRRQRLVAGGNASEARGRACKVDVKSRPRRPFRFLSTFKWEPRKGWDVLLEAYLSEFAPEDRVELYILTKPFKGGKDIKQEMQKWAAHSLLRNGQPPHKLAVLPDVYVITRHVSDMELPRYYKAADAFVLPSRGEGWGRPHVEAMSMGLPLIATNWSGVTAYLDESVGYPIKVDRLVAVSDGSNKWFDGHRWAQPSVAHLRQLMRRVVTHRQEARQRGKAARRLMVTRFSADVVARKVEAELRRVDALIPSVEDVLGPGGT